MMSKTNAQSCDRVRS